MAGFNLTRLYGGRTPIQFDSSDPDAPIVVWCHYPTQEESAMAYKRAGLTLDDNGIAIHPSGVKIDELLGLLQAKVELACLCIDDVENLDDWPSVCTEIAPFGLTRLTAAAIDLLPRYVLQEVGMKLLLGSQVSEEEGND